MSAADNKKLIQDVFAAWAGGDGAAFFNILADDVRWTVIVTGNGSTAASKRFILGVRQLGGNGYFLPITLDTMVTK